MIRCHFSIVASVLLSEADLATVAIQHRKKTDGFFAEMKGIISEDQSEYSTTIAILTAL